MRSPFRAILPTVTILLAVAACNDDDPVATTGPFDLTVQGGAEYQAPHGGDAITLGLFTDDLELIEVQTGTVSASATPSWSFSFPGALEAGESYVVNYWIDSNFGEEATEGECDPPLVDHQWSVPFGPVEDDVLIERTHDTGALTPVCDTFE